MTTDKPTKKLFLIDAMALIYRAYFAFKNNPMYNSKGLNTSAIFGFTNSLLEVLNKEMPSHIAVAFDSPVKTIRHEEYKEYKATRDATPEDISLSIPYIKQIIDALNIPILQVDRYEADDIIGAIAKKAEKHGFVTYMMTPDKDFGQLVSENIFIYKPARMGNKAEVLGITEVCEKFEINEPTQLIDILGLWGDSVDNIPGVPGVGEKTAKKLIGEFGSIENLLENTDKLKGKLKENVEEYALQAALSKKLATIILDVPVDFNEKQMEVSEPDKDMLETIFEELEFRALAKKMLGDSIFDSIKSVKHNYYLADTPEKRKSLIKNLSGQESFCFDTETTSLNTHEAELVGIAFSFKSHEAYFVPFSKIRTGKPPEIEETGQTKIDLFSENIESENDTAISEEALKIAREFVPVFENQEIEKIGQNIKYDIEVLLRYGIEVKGSMFDTMLAHYLIQPDREHNLDSLSKTYLKYAPIPIESLIGKKGKNQSSMLSVPIDLLVDYACEDADITFQLKKVFEPKLIETNTFKLFNEVEIPLIPVLV